MPVSEPAKPTPRAEPNRNSRRDSARLSSVTTAIHLMKLLEVAGLPAGVADLVVGDGPDAGAPLSADPRGDLVLCADPGRRGFGRWAGPV